jgi:hypothetical protein
VIIVASEEEAYHKRTYLNHPNLILQDLTRAVYTLLNTNINILVRSTTTLILLLILRM